ncbi:MAG TPA: alpha/beta hydrolase family protein, partial [Pirellulales bacterium]
MPHPILPHRRGALKLIVTIAVLAYAQVSQSNISRADAPRVLPEGKLPDDARLGPLKDLNGYFPFSVGQSPEAWKERAERVRRQLLVATGLWPMPTKTPLNAKIYGRVDRDGYTVEKVTLESYPNFFVTGNLYRPNGKSGKLPGVLSPHGHFPTGRFYETPLKEVRQQFVEGAERFDVGGRYPHQARCVTLARMGCVAFTWDMVGYADSQQISEDVAHHYKKRRPEMETPTGWGFFSPQAELQLQTIMGLQTYNSLRVLDWFSSLPDVDPTRIGVTGESGGGTQTMLIGALDSRPAVLFPAVMVSTAMQGGCTCENCNYLRVGTGNIEFAAMAAPRPLGMTAADDWTKEIAAKGLPELERHYAMLGVPKNVTAKVLTQFPHNYNYVSRAVMYRFMNDYLKLGLENPIVEEDFKPLSIPEMKVWDADHPRPPS